MGNYPLPKYHFTVDLGGTPTSISEITGLSYEIAVIEHRDGASPGTSSSKLPGLRKYSNIVLKRPVQKGDKTFYDWISSVQANSSFRRDLTITLLDHEHQPVLTWKVKNAWPCKYEHGSLNATANEVLFETIELTHEGLQIET